MEDDGDNDSDNNDDGEAKECDGEKNDDHHERGLRYRTGTHSRQTRWTRISASLHHHHHYHYTHPPHGTTRHDADAGAPLYRPAMT